MLYSRHDFVELVRTQPKELQSTLIAIIWYASKGNPNEQNGNRYGLLQIDLNQAKLRGYDRQPTWLLDPALNIQFGAQLLSDIGLLEFCGRELAPQLPNIMALAQFLDSEQEKTPVETGV